MCRCGCVYACFLRLYCGIKLAAGGCVVLHVSVVCVGE